MTLLNFEMESLIISYHDMNKYTTLLRLRDSLPNTSDRERCRLITDCILILESMSEEDYYAIVNPHTSNRLNH